MTAGPSQVPRKHPLPWVFPVPFPHPCRRICPAKPLRSLSASRPSLCRGRLSGAVAMPRGCKGEPFPQAVPAACTPRLAVAGECQAHQTGWQGPRGTGPPGFLSWCRGAWPRWKWWAGQSSPSPLCSRCMAPEPWYPCRHQLTSQRADVTRVYGAQQDAPEQWAQPPGSLRSLACAREQPAWARKGVLVGWAVWSPVCGCPQRTPAASWVPG